MRVGVISNGSPDYLIDIVTDGLIRLLGRHQVSLQYNVRGGWGGQYAILLQGFQGPEPFDIRESDVLLGSTRSFPQIEDWMEKSGNRKVAIIDGEDDDRLRPEWVEKARVYFKREYPKGRSYPKNVLPLPFAAIPEDLPNVTEIVSPVFFMAHGSSPIRGEISEALKRAGYPVPSERVEKANYNISLASSLVGISARGGGWDTYRYWEVPYFGVTLLSQRLQTVIPDDFTEGREALFFSDVHEVPDILKVMLKDPLRTREMGRLGREKCLQYHLSTNRAKTVLENLS
jgi:hypothetical protein